MHIKVKNDVPLNLPNLQDEVKHKCQSDFIGIVIAKYPMIVNPPWKWNPFNFFKDKVPQKVDWLLDVRLNTDQIFYGTPAVNWETIRTEEERL